jgi:hypothetical protein
MATLLKVLNNLADIKSAGGVALGLGTQGRDIPEDVNVVVMLPTDPWRPRRRFKLGKDEGGGE